MIKTVKMNKLFRKKSTKLMRTKMVNLRIVTMKPKIHSKDESVLTMKRKMKTTKVVID
jgi:hypothetical protein